MRFWNRNKPDHDCKKHCGHAQILENVVNEQIRPKEHEKLDEYYQMQSDFENHDCNKTCDHLSEGDANSPIIQSYEAGKGTKYGGFITTNIRIKYQNDVDLVRFLKEVLKVKKYQLIAKKYNLEFEFGED